MSAARGRPQQARVSSGSTGAARPPGEVRIIGGQWKRSKLAVARQDGLRPTPDRVRETLFNWLGQDMTGLRCVDAFAGSGALGFEAASRGAARVVLIEQAAPLVAMLRANATRLQAGNLEIVPGDAVAWLRQHAGEGWDLVFLDPPFGQAALFEQALAAARRALAPEGFIYLEAPRTWTAEELAALGLSLRRQGRAGQVHFHLLHTADNLSP